MWLSAARFLGLDLFFFFLTILRVSCVGSMNSMLESSGACICKVAYSSTAVVVVAAVVLLRVFLLWVTLLTLEYLPGIGGRAGLTAVVPSVIVDSNTDGVRRSICCWARDCKFAGRGVICCKLLGVGSSKEGKTGKTPVLGVSGAFGGTSGPLGGVSGPLGGASGPLEVASGPLEVASGPLEGSTGPLGDCVRGTDTVLMSDISGLRRVFAGLGL